MCENVFTRLVIKIFHSCHTSVVRVALMLHLCRSCSTLVALMLLMSHLCCTRAARVALVSLVSGTRVVKWTSMFEISNRIKKLFRLHGNIITVQLSN